MLLLRSSLNPTISFVFLLFRPHFPLSVDLPIKCGTTDGIASLSIENGTATQQHIIVEPRRRQLMLLGHRAPTQCLNHNDDIDTERIRKRGGVRGYV